MATDNRNRTSEQYQQTFHSYCFVFFFVYIRFFFHNFIYETKIEKKRYSKLFVQNQYGQKVTFFNTR